MKTVPYAHQVEAFRRSKEAKEFALFMEMGSGKTKVALDTLCYLWQNSKIDRALVIAPKGVVPVWSEQLALHMWDEVPMSLAIWNTAKKDCGLAPVAPSSVTAVVRILLMNVEALSTRRGVLAAKDFLVQGPGLMVVDESTTIKTGGSNRSKGACWLGRMAAYRRILTGMPIEQSPLDLYAQCEFLRPGLLGHRSFYSFRGAYANLVAIKVPGKGVVAMPAGGVRPRKQTVQKITGYRDLERLARTLKTFSYRVTKEECLDLPPKVFQTVEVELSLEQKRAYTDMRDRAVVAIEGADQQSTAVIAITQLLRLHQIVCGHLVLDSGDVVALPHNRLTTLLGLLEEVQGKAVIWASYRRDVLAIWTKLQETYGVPSTVAYYGDTYQEQRVQNLDRFQNDPTCRFFVGTPRTAGMGLTLTQARTMVYYSNSHSVRDRVQSEDRAHRIGQTQSLAIIDLVCRKTIDEGILLALKAKQELAALVVGDGWKSLIGEML